MSVCSTQLIFYPVYIIILYNNYYTASGTDYQALTMDATFTSSQSQVCGSIQTWLEMLQIYENNEVFSVSLSDASANPRIRLGAQKTVRIRDTDSKF